jgi:hypothetical protein
VLIRSYTHIGWTKHLHLYNLRFELNDRRNTPYGWGKSSLAYTKNQLSIYSSRPIQTVQYKIYSGIVCSNKEIDLDHIVVRRQLYGGLYVATLEVGSTRILRQDATLDTLPAVDITMECSMHVLIVWSFICG